MLAWTVARYLARSFVWSGRPDAETLGLALSVAVGAAVWLATEWWVGLVVTVVAAIALALAQREKEVYDAAMALVAMHAKELAIRRSQTVVQGSYGVKNESAWQREIGYFMERVLAPKVGRISAVSPLHSRLCRQIDKTACSVPLTRDFHPGIDPIEYEHFVAETLRRHGWDARTTQASADQGVDVVATRGPVTLAVQCKLYSKPVGNAAVQEAIAGRQFLNAEHAAVVSNSNFTRAAKELAASAGVLLLHHEQLTDLSDLLSSPIHALGWPR